MYLPLRAVLQPSLQHSFNLTAAVINVQIPILFIRIEDLCLCGRTIYLVPADRILPFLLKASLDFPDLIVHKRIHPLCEKAGADAIVVSHHHGRLPFAVPPAVTVKLRQMNNQLKELMGYTGVEALDAFDPTVLWYHGRRLVNIL